ncbi:hypothetical protein [Propionicimonas sp. T2.31MG-18]|uniref:hypothetical protein n=1 Tax=Propionicimonas sp. T2.31MG-18 TaxID=3157620 RepID=UPI00367157D0
MKDSAPRLPSIQLEFTDPTLLGMTLKEPVASELIAACTALLGQVAVEPDRCRLIITGDFLESARQRMEPGPYRDSYGMDRSTGVVGGKTMPMPDGTIDVLLPDILFALDKTPEQHAACARIAIHTVLHEGQHVAMTQAGETDPELSHLPRGRMNLEAVADQVIQEYRAERAIDHSVSSDNEWDLPGVLEHWHAALVRVACVEYQEHLDVERLWYGIVQETHTAWKLLAYLAARIPDGVSPKRAISDDVRKSRLWRVMVKPHWRRFVETLGQVPPGNIRTNRTALDAVQRVLADEFDAWLLTLGFEAVDDTDGFAFYIRDWSVLEM